MKSVLARGPLFIIDHATKANLCVSLQQSGELVERSFSGAVPKRLGGSKTSRDDPCGSASGLEPCQTVRGLLSAK